MELVARARAPLLTASPTRVVVERRASARAAPGVKIPLRGYEADSVTALGGGQIDGRNAGDLPAFRAGVVLSL